MVGAAEIKNMISNLQTVVDEIEVDDIMKEADPAETGRVSAMDGSPASCLTDAHKPNIPHPLSSASSRGPSTAGRLCGLLEDDLCAVVYICTAPRLP